MSVTVDQIKELLIAPEENFSDDEGLVVDYLAENNRKEYNIGKVNEEIFEVGEAFNKYLNKAPDFKPKIETIFEEFGDLLFRLRIWAVQEFGKEQADELFEHSVVHVEKKERKFAKHIVDGKYKGGI